MQRTPADDADEDDTLELTPDMEVEEDEGPEDEPEEGESEGEGVSGDEGEEEGPPAFEDEADEEAKGDSRTIRQMRDRLAEQNRELAELRSRAPQAPAELPPKPTLAELDYDEEAFEQRLDAWKDQKRQLEQAEAERNAQVESATREWQRDLESYTRRRDELALPDFEDAAEAVKTRLTLAQQAVIVKAASDAPAFVYALAHSDTRLAELAKLQDPIKLAAAIARMEGAVKV